MGWGGASRLLLALGIAVWTLIDWVHRFSEGGPVQSLDRAHAAIAPNFLAGVSTAGDFSACPCDGHLFSFARRGIQFCVWVLGVHFAWTLADGPSYRARGREPMELSSVAANALAADCNGHGGRFALHGFRSSLAAS